MERKENKNQKQKGLEKKDHKDLTETIDEELHLLMEEETKVKEKEIDELKKKL